MKLVGISGKKYSGKSTTANILHGIVMKENNLIKDFSINSAGKLIVLTTNAEGQEGWGEFDITRKDQDFVQYAEYNLWPYVKVYGFAGQLKRIGVELFNIPYECCYGTEEQKNQIQEHLLWENMPKFENTPLARKILQPPDSLMSWAWKEGPMTAREFLQFFGTDICRQIYEPVWFSSCLKKIQREQPLLAIIEDVRFDNEVEAIEEAGGKVVRLSREVFEDGHSSEVALDNYTFTDYIANKDGNIEDLVVKVKQFYTYLKEPYVSNLR